MDDGTPVLAISGSMGAGKTTVMGSASTLLAEAGIQHAALDLDFLTEGHYTEDPDTLMLRNLSTVWRNYAAAGARRVVVCKPIDTMAKREQLLTTIPNARLVVCRLRASLETMRARVRVREPGPDRERFVAHVATLERYLDANQVEDFSVDNDGRPVHEVARELLTRAGWL